MNQDNSENILLQGRVLPLFFRYAVPGLLTLLLVSSSAIVDGIFAGKFIGHEALAAINLINPAMGFTSALAMVVIGGSTAVCGKYLGAGEEDKAQALFTKSIIFLVCLSSIIALIVFVGAKVIAEALGASGTVLPMAVTYLQAITLAVLFNIPLIAMAVYTKLVGFPLVAAGLSIMVTIINISLNYIFTVYLKLGIFGIAFSTSIACAIGCITYFIVFGYLKGNKLHFTRHIGRLNDLWYSIYNGSSEFVNNASAALVTFLLNNTIIKLVDVNAVAALTVNNYALLISVMSATGISEALNSLISTNYGAKQYQRVYQFRRYGYLAIYVINCIMFLLLALMPSQIVNTFIETDNRAVITVAMEYMRYFKYILLFNGANIISTVFFTATSSPLPSLLIALSRSLILPVSLVILLPLLFGIKGLYVAMPITELLTLMLTFYLLRRHKFSD